MGPAFDTLFTFVAWDSSHHACFRISVLEIAFPMRILFQFWSPVQRRPFRLIFEQPHGFDVLSESSTQPLNYERWERTFLLSVVKRWKIPAGKISKSSFSKLILTHSSFSFRTSKKPFPSRMYRISSSSWRCSL